MVSRDDHLSLMRHCADTCRTTLFDHCIRKGGEHVAPAHVQAMVDCITLCDTTVDFMMRKSPHQTELCTVCAEVCTACADTCAAMADDEVMQECADICRQCADACAEMGKRAARRTAA